MKVPDSGIYRIVGPNGKFYVGSAISIRRRWIEHRRDLRRGDHANKKLQAAWNRYGEGAFSISTLETVGRLDMLLDREQFWLDQLLAVANGYNILPIAGSNFGNKHSEETRQKMSSAHKGRKHGPMSDDQKAYYSRLYSGRKLSKETREKMGASRLGRKHSPESRALMSQKAAGRVISEEHKAKLSAANTGKKASPETKEKMRAAQKNRKPISEETRERMRSAAKRRESQSRGSRSTI